MNLVFIAAFFSIVISSRNNYEESLRFGMNGFFAIAALSSIYGISCVSSLLFFSFDLEDFLGQYFSIGSEFEVKRDWSIAGIFRGPGLSGINNSAIFYSSIIPSLFYFSFMHSKTSSKRYQFLLLLITAGCLVTISRIGIFLALLSILIMLVLRYGLLRLIIF